MHLNHARRRFTLRQRMYLFAFIACLMLLSPMTVYAWDLLNTRIMDVYTSITMNVEETNEILQSAVEFSTQSPYYIINDLANHNAAQAGILRTIKQSSQTAALAVATLLLFVEFFRKSVNFEWSSKWENILLFLIKIIVMKQVVQNADVIMGSIYSLFNYINNSVTGAVGNVDFLPQGQMTIYHFRDTGGFFTKAFDKPWWEFWTDSSGGGTSPDVLYEYRISKDAVRMFYPNASFPDGFGPGDYAGGRLREFTLPDGMTDLPNPTSTTFTPTLEKLLIQPYFWIMKACAYLIYVITIGRVFELCLYTIFAPLPLATFASDTTHDVAKNFIKNYIAVILQMAVIIAMFSIYMAIVYSLNTLIRGTALNFLRFIGLLTLSMSILKSGTWAKKICGIG